MSQVWFEQFQNFRNGQHNNPMHWLYMFCLFFMLFKPQTRPRGTNLGSQTIWDITKWFNNITKWLISITIWVFQIAFTTPNQKRENYQKAFPDKRVDVELGQKFHNFNILYKNFPLDDSRDS